MNTEQHRTARKKHICDWCGGQINLGTRYVMSSKPTGGSWQTDRMHVACHMDSLTPEIDVDYAQEDADEARRWAREQGFDFDTGIPHYGDI